MLGKNAVQGLDTIMEFEYFYTVNGTSSAVLQLGQGALGSEICIMWRISSLVRTAFVLLAYITTPDAQ